MSDLDAQIRPAARILIVVFCVAAFLLIVVILTGSKLDDTSGKAIATAVAFALFALTGMAGIGLADRHPPASLFGQAVALISLAAFVVAVASLWTNSHWEPAAILLTLALGGGHASLLVKGTKDTDDQAVRVTRAGVLVAIAVLCTMIVADVLNRGDNLDPRVYGVIAVLYLLGALVLPLLRRSKAATSAPMEGPRSAIDILRDNGLAIVEEPVSRDGTYGPGEGVCFRDANGRLIELITYGKEI